MTTALYPGSFDPLHNGHLRVIERTAQSFDRVLVAVLQNPAKRGFLPAAQRVALAAQAVAHVGNASAVSFEGLAVDAAASLGADVLVRSWAKEYEIELMMAAANQRLSGINTVFVPGPASAAGISSTLVRALLGAGKLDDVRRMTPPAVYDALAG